jgi:S-(hydroxymethyl)glutathione synthase
MTRATFVSSVTEGGFPVDQMDGVRDWLNEPRLARHDCLSPPLMDAIAARSAAKA